MKFILLLLIFGCASTPKVPEDVCYTHAENAALGRALHEQNEAIDELNAQIRTDRRESEKWHTRNEGLKGYCT